MATIVMICLGKQNEQGNNVIQLLSVLLSSEVTANDKKQILQDKFNIPMSYEMEKEVKTMCNLSDGVERRGYNRGLEQGLDFGRINSLKSYIKKKKVTIDEAFDDLDIPEVKRSEYRVILNEE